MFKLPSWIIYFLGFVIILNFTWEDKTNFQFSKLEAFYVTLSEISNVCSFDSWGITNFKNVLNKSTKKPNQILLKPPMMRMKTKILQKQAVYACLNCFAYYKQVYFIVIIIWQAHSFMYTLQCPNMFFHYKDMPAKTQTFLYNYFLGICFNKFKKFLQRGKGKKWGSKSVFSANLMEACSIFEETF